MTRLGNFIKNYRDDHNLSLRSFATLSGLSHTYIEKLEKGLDPRSGKPVVPTIITLQAIAKATGTPLLELLYISGYLPDLPNPTQSTAAIKENPSSYTDPATTNPDQLRLLLKQVKDLSPQTISHITSYIESAKDKDTNKK